MPKTQSIGIHDLRAGMKTAHHKRDGSVVPGQTVAKVETHRDGGATVGFTDGTYLYLNPWEMSNGITLEII